MDKLKITLISESASFLEITKKHLRINKIEVETMSNAFNLQPNRLYLIHFCERNLADVEKVETRLRNIDATTIYIVPERLDYIRQKNLDHLFLKEKPTQLEFKIFLKLVLARIEKISKTITSKKAESNEAYDKVIAIGASTGGAEAVQKVLRNIPKNLAPIVVAIHMPAGFTRSFAKNMNDICEIRVKEAMSGDILKNNVAYIAPGGKHMSIKKTGKDFTIVCEEGPKINNYIPCIDVLFDSVAKEVGRKSMGVILTGMGIDGSKGLLRIKNAGGYTIGQDEQSSVVYGMPKEAFSIGAVKDQAPVTEIYKFLIKNAKR